MNSHNVIIRQKTMPRFRIGLGTINALFAVLLLMVPIGLWNRYIFKESNVYILGLFVMIAALLVVHGKIPRNLFPSITITFLLIISYAWIRLDDPFSFDLSTRIYYNYYVNGFTHVVYHIIYYLLFISAALIYSKTGSFSKLLWLIICAYMVALILRISMAGIEEIQSGANLGPGFVLLAFLPFVFLRWNDGVSKIAVILSLICFFWLALIGSRTGTMAILIFLGVFFAWPWIIKSKIRYVLIFISYLLIIFLFSVLLIFVGLNYDSQILNYDSSFKALNKGTAASGREIIWSQLLYLISNNPLWGYGTDASSILQQPIIEIPFRDNLSAHSLYIEILHRLGIFGLLAYLILFFLIWRFFWNGRRELAVRIAGAFLFAALFFSTTADFLFFTDMSIQCGFAWIMLGIGAGACIKTKSLKCTMKPMNKC